MTSSDTPEFKAFMYRADHTSVQMELLAGFLSLLPFISRDRANSSFLRRRFGIFDEHGYQSFDDRDFGEELKTQLFDNVFESLARTHLQYNGEGASKADFDRYFAKAMKKGDFRKLFNEIASEIVEKQHLFYKRPKAGEFGSVLIKTSARPGEGIMTAQDFFVDRIKTRLASGDYDRDGFSFEFNHS